MKVQLSFALAAALLIPVALRAEDKPKAVNDADFLIKSISCGVAETKLAQMAEKRAANPEVKEFAQKLNADHKAANEKLMQFAKDAKLAVVAGTEKQQREVASRLSKLEGADFDRAYLQQMVEDHDKSIALFESYSKTGGNPDLKNMAEKALPTLREHRKEAAALLEKVKK